MQAPPAQDPCVVDDADELGDIVLQEGNEEAEYVVIELDPKIGKRLMDEGASIVIQGLDTDTPTMLLPNGSWLAGSYEEHLGSIMLFEERPGEAAGGTLGYKAHTEKKLIFSTTSSLQ